MRIANKAKTAVAAAAVVLFFAATAHAATTKSVRVMFEIPSYVRFHDPEDHDRRNNDKDNWKEDKEEKIKDKKEKHENNDTIDSTSNCNWKVEMESSYNGKSEKSATFSFEPGESKLDISEEMKAEVEKIAENAADGTNGKKVIVVRYTVMTD